MSVLNSKRRAVTTLYLCLILLAGCARSQPSRFYVLHSITGPAPVMQGEPVSQPGVVGIMPVQVPEYLDRPQIVTRTNTNELRFAEFHRWGEPLDKNIARVLMENLSNMMPSARIALFPWPKAMKMRYELAVEVIQLEGLPGGTVSLTARWSIFGENNTKVMAMKKSTFSRPADSRSYETLISAENEMLADLCREIAGQLDILFAEQPGA